MGDNGNSSIGTENRISNKDWRECRDEILRIQSSEKQHQPDSVREKHGRRIGLSNGRRLVDDVIRYAKEAPLSAVSRDLDLNYLHKLRRITRPRLSWNVLMMKAYGIVCAQRPELRQIYVSFPWPHLYQHPDSICMITMIREYRGEQRLFFARFADPEKLSLRQLQNRYDFFRRAPVDEIKQFRHQMTFAKFPWFLRRAAWWTMFNLWPSKRATHMGTFGMSLSGYQGAFGSQHLGPNTSIIGVDPRPRKGLSKLLYTFDHRIIDGKPATDIVEALRLALLRPICIEIEKMLVAEGIDPKKATGRAA